MERTIPRVVHGALEHVEHVLVVDDGSSDATASAARAAGAEVLAHEATRGKGAALRTGMVHLLGEGFSHAFCLDGDGQHLPEEMPLLIREAEASPSALVIGARRLEPGQAVAPIRRFGNAFADWWVSLAAGRDLPDTQSGFRIYPLEIALNLGIQGDRYEFESDALIRACHRKIDVRSCEVRVHYPPPGELVSHYDGWLDTIRIIATVVPHLLWRPR